MAMSEEAEKHRPEVSRETLSERIRHEVHYNVVFDKKVDFTFELAHKFIEMDTFDGERNLRDAHVEFLVSEAKRGTFLWDTASLISCDCEYDKTERRLNGQHTAWMRTYLPDKLDAKINWIKYAVKTEDDFRKLYAAIDRGAPRTITHIVQAILYGSQEFNGVSKEVLAYLQKGLKILLMDTAGKSRSRVTIDKITDAMKTTHLSISLEVGRLLDYVKMANNKCPHMRRASVYAAMFATSSKHREESKAFWTMVADGIGMTDSTDPRYKLREYLQRTSVDTGNGSRTGIKSTSAEDMFKTCVHMWNFHRKGEKVKVIKTPEKRPIAK